MPVYPPANNPLVVKAALMFTRDTRNLVNTLHFTKSAGWNLASMTVLAQDLKNWWSTIYRASIPPAVALSQIQIRLLDPTNPLAVDLPVIPTIAGTRAGSPDAGNVSVTLSERTGLAGRAHRGRIYAPSLMETDVSDTDTLASVTVTSLANAIANLIFGFSTNSAFPVIFHRPGLIPKPLDNAFDLVTSYVLENIIDSQRRRLPGRGR